MSKGFKADVNALDRASRRQLEHAVRVESHSRNLDSRTRGKVLGRGKFGKIIQDAVGPIIESMIGDMSKSMAKGHRSLGQGLEITRKNIADAEKAVENSFKKHHKSLKAEGLDLKPGQSVPDKKSLRNLYHRRVEERVDELDREGHGVGRHLNVTDQQLKDRLGTPSIQRRKLKDENGNWVLDENGDKVEVDELVRARHGYAQSEGKVDPLHGPDARSRLSPPDLYYDVDKGAPNRHKCDAHSTAFNDHESFMYADAYARSKIDPNRPGDQVFEFSPSDAYGPGGHAGRFRGFYIDPDEPMKGGEINYKESDFKDATIKAIYRPDGNGGHKLHTMFPQPVFKHNRSPDQGIPH
ncbi:hypothetical protein ACWGGS_16910 [Streptomyces decoyicus]